MRAVGSAARGLRLTAFAGDGTRPAGHETRPAGDGTRPAGHETRTAFAGDDTTPPAHGKARRRPCLPGRTP